MGVKIPVLSFSNSEMLRDHLRNRFVRDGLHVIAARNYPDDGQFSIGLGKRRSYEMVEHVRVSHTDLAKPGESATLERLGWWLEFGPYRAVRAT